MRCFVVLDRHFPNPPCAVKHFFDRFADGVLRGRDRAPPDCSARSPTVGCNLNGFLKPFGFGLLKGKT